MALDETHLQEFYRSYHDRIFEKRLNSPYPIRRSVHWNIYNSVLQYVQPRMSVLDAGCGEGCLSLLMARKGARVTAVDCSCANITSALQQQVNVTGHCNRVDFVLGDAEMLPFADSSFDLVVSNHVIEHLSNAERGVAEVARVAKQQAVIAMPSCLSPYAWCLLGGAPYWTLTKKTAIALPLGLLRVGFALFTNRERVNEGYVGKRDIQHVFRFPWKIRRLLEKCGLQILDERPQAVGVPYIGRPLSNESLLTCLKHFGVGTLFLVKKKR